MQTPMNILTQHPIRKSKAQKRAFRDDLQAYAAKMGYNCTIEKGVLRANNVILGDPDSAKYLNTAHYDTPARMPFPNFITPCNLPMFLLYQLVMTIVMVFLPAIPAMIVSACTDDFALSYLTWYGLFMLQTFLMMFGPANKTNVNDNTSGVIAALTLAGKLPQEYRDKVCFVLFDLEEAGLIGSASYRNTHKKATDDQIVLNLDCIGDGEEIVIFPNKKFRSNKLKMDNIRSLTCEKEGRKIVVHEKGFAYCPSDHAHFPYGAGIMAFRRAKWIGLYCDKIHTNRDTVLEENNITMITDAILALVCK